MYHINNKYLVDPVIVDKILAYTLDGRDWLKESSHVCNRCFFAIKMD